MDVQLLHKDLLGSEGKTKTINYLLPSRITESGESPYESRKKTETAAETSITCVHRH